MASAPPSKPHETFPNITLGEPIPVKPRLLAPMIRRRKSKGPRKVYGYYVVPYDFFMEAEKNGAPTVHNSSWATFYVLRVDICKATGLPNNSRTFRPITSVGYCIVLAENTSDWDRHPPDFEENLKIVKGLLRTNEEPKWYLDRQRF